MLLTIVNQTISITHQIHHVFTYAWVMLRWRQWQILHRLRVKKLLKKYFGVRREILKFKAFFREFIFFNPLWFFFDPTACTVPAHEVLRVRTSVGERALGTRRTHARNPHAYQLLKLKQVAGPSRERQYRRWKGRPKGPRGAQRHQHPNAWSEVMTRPNVDPTGGSSARPIIRRVGRVKQCPGVKQRFQP